MLAIASALEGMSRAAAAQAAGMDRQTLRDWVIRYNRAGVAALLDHWGTGRPCRLTEGQQATLKAIVLQGPDPDVDGVSTWRLVDLCRIVRERFGVSYGKTGMARLMRSLELSWQTPRPRHAGTDPAVQAAFKKGDLPPPWPASPPSIPRRSASRSGSAMRPGLARRAD
jgi:transposase